MRSKGLRRRRGRESSAKPNPKERIEDRVRKNRLRNVHSAPAAENEIIINGRIRLMMAGG